MMRDIVSTFWVLLIGNTSVKPFFLLGFEVFAILLEDVEILTESVYSVLGPFLSCIVVRRQWWVIGIPWKLGRISTIFKGYAIFLVFFPVIWSRGVAVVCYAKDSSLQNRSRCWDITSATAVLSNTLLLFWFVECRMSALSWGLVNWVLETSEESDVAAWSHMLVWSFLLHWRHLLLERQAQTKCCPRQMKHNFFLLTILIRSGRAVTLLQLIEVWLLPQKHMPRLWIPVPSHLTFSALVPCVLLHPWRMTLLPPVLQVRMSHCLPLERSILCEELGVTQPTYNCHCHFPALDACEFRRVV